MTEEVLSKAEKKALLGLARSAIADKLKTGDAAFQPEESPGLEMKSGAFVTLHKKGRLRGCIGRFTSDFPITDTVQEMARAAAFEDPRFNPLSASELQEVDVEISVLTPMRLVSSTDEIQVGKHGIYIINGPSRGVLLPQVATEQGWDRQTFIEHTCLKAGLGKNCWQEAETEIYVFTAEVFGELD